MLHSVVVLSYLLLAYAQTNTNTGFVGYRKTGNSYVSVTCPDTSATVATSGSYWGCSPYPAAGLGLVTGCTSGTLLVSGNERYACNTGYECNTGYLFSDLNDQSPLTDYVCFDGGTTSYYRSLPASVLAAVTGVTSSASSTQTSFTTGSSFPVPSLPTETSHSSSKAWIAGAVIGPIVGLALLVGLGVLIWALRRQIKQRQLTQQPVPAPVSSPGTTSPAPMGEHEGAWVFVPVESPALALQTESHPPGWL